MEDQTCRNRFLKYLAGDFFLLNIEVTIEILFRMLCDFEAGYQDSPQIPFTYP